MPGFWEVLIELVALLCLAFLFGLAAQRLKQDAVVGHLLAGLLVGPGVFGLVRGVELVTVLAELGVALLLFTIGLEFSLPKLRALGRVALLGGTLQIILTVALAQPIAALLGLPLSAGIALGLSLSLSSTAIVLRLIAARSEGDSPFGRAATGILLLQDLALAPLLILLQTMAEGRQGIDGLLGVLTSLAKAAALGAALYFVLRSVLPWLVRGSAPQLLREAPAVLSIVTCLGCTWAAHALGLSPALGAFLGGALLGELPYAHQIRADVVPLRAVFVTLFFASIGMLATPPRLADLGLVLLLALSILFVKTVAASLALRAAGVPIRIATRAAVLVSQIGEFSFVMLTFAQANDLLAARPASLFVSASVLTMFATPYLFVLAPRIAGLFGFKPDIPAPASSATQPVIVAGHGPAGQQVTSTLTSLGLDVHVIDINPTSTGAHVHFGDAAQPEILDEAGILSARALIVTVPDPAAAAAIVNAARTLRPMMPVIVRARYNRSSQSLLATGASDVVDEELTVGRVLAARALRALRISAFPSSGDRRS